MVKIVTLPTVESRKLYIETYGCQMNVLDSEVVAAILQQRNYTVTGEIAEADLVLVNTCSIRDNAEQRVWSRLRELGKLKQNNPSLSVGVIGCMAERLKEKLLEEENRAGIDITKFYTGSDKSSSTSDST